MAYVSSVALLQYGSDGKSSLIEVPKNVAAELRTKSTETSKLLDEIRLIESLGDAAEFGVYRQEPRYLKTVLQRRNNPSSGAASDALVSEISNVLTSTDDDPQSKLPYFVLFRTETQS